MSQLNSTDLRALGTAMAYGMIRADNPMFKTENAARRCIVKLTKQGLLIHVTDAPGSEWAWKSTQAGRAAYEQGTGVSVGSYGKGLMP